MLELAERVASRSREYLIPKTGDPDRSQSFSALQTFHSYRESHGMRLHVDLNPSPVNEIWLQPGNFIRNEGLRNTLGDSNCSRSGSTRLNLSSLPDVSPSFTRKRPLRLDSGNLEERQDWLTFDDAPLSLNGRSWDEVDERINGTRMIELHSLPRILDFDPRFKRILLAAAANAILGFSSSLLAWDEPNCRLQLNPVILEASFAGFLLKFAETGTLLRRLSISVLDIRAHAKNRESQTALALAAAIERFVASFQANGHLFHQAQCLIELSTISDAITEQVYILAELIGCTGKRGRLRRLPSTVDLLQRVYTRAEALDSDMLWSIASSCFTPWMEQLNYVAGLTNTLQMRVMKKESKHFWFPELFIEILEDSNTASIDSSLVPHFLSTISVNAIRHCFELLCCLSLKGPDAIKRAGQPSMSPIPTSTRSGWGFHGLISNQTQEISKSIDLPDTILSSSFDSKVLEMPKSIHHELRKIMSIVTSRSEELDLQVKQEFAAELREMEHVIVGLFLLNDGVIWSQLSDHVINLFESEHSFFRNLRLVNATVASRYNVRISADRESRELHISCQLPYVDRLLGPGFMSDCQRMFNKVLHLYITHRFAELALLGVEIEAVASDIHTAITSQTTGMHAVRTAFNSCLLLDQTWNNMSA